MFKGRPCAAVMCVDGVPAPCAQGSQSGGQVQMCLRGCGVGLIPRHVSQPEGSACGHCGAHRRCGARSWRCSLCSAGFRPKCRRTGDRTDLDTQTRAVIEVLITEAIPGGELLGPDCVAFGGPDKRHADGFLGALLRGLTALPPVAPAASYSYVPKSLARRVGRLVSAALSWFGDEASASDQQRQLCAAASLFLKHLGFSLPAT